MSFTPTDINTVNIIQSKKAKFYQRVLTIPLICNQQDDHDWKLLIYDQNERPMLAIAMCRKCLLVDGGIVNYEEQTKC